MNKPDATRRSKGSVRRVERAADVQPDGVNALTDFLRAKVPGRYNQTQFAKAAGFSRDTANRLLNDDSLVLARMPSEKIIAGIAKALDERIERIEAIARKATNPHDPVLPPALADLERAHTDDLRAELARREDLVKAENRRREEMRKDLELAWLGAAVSLFNEEALARELGQLSVEQRSDMGGAAFTVWEPERRDRIRLIVQAVNELGGEAAEEVERFLSPENLARRYEVFLKARRKQERYENMTVNSDKLEDDPLPAEQFESEMEFLREKFGVDVHSKPGLIHIDLGVIPDLRSLSRELLGTEPPPLQAQLTVGLNKAVGVNRNSLYNLTRRAKRMHQRVGAAPAGAPPPAGSSEGELGWAARDYPDWAEKPDLQEDPDGGV